MQKELDPVAVNLLLDRLKQLAIAHRCTRIRFLKPPDLWKSVLQDLGATIEQSSTVLEL
ncbi:MAG: hypothetical protein K9W43_14010 [Candidatus Thorarchaeota archaeon]|nr:hypothetical protein [Candidatus Thorarchaeota archaeon]